ncbi:NYN domain-containing protein [Stomatohabitans albus]|uniref:NYN domain-containing protein n=1 Tax=Stomatohabitans albus TaxID=3110766 RepID=UPI00300C9865
MAEEERIALFLDYENLAIGAREDLRGMQFDLRPLADALAERGRVVVRKAYADWTSFDEDRRMLTKEQVELIEIPQRLGAVRKNAADIKMAVDAIELVFERDYISTFVICTGDSDFTPLVNKLRELNKRVIGVGLKASTSKLLPPACDEFIFYELLEGVDLPTRPKKNRKKQNDRHKGTVPAPTKAAKTVPVSKVAVVEDIDDVDDGDDTLEVTEHTIENLTKIVTSTLGGLIRTAHGPVTASQLKRAMLRKDPTFTEAEYGFRGFGEALQDLASRGDIELSDGPSQGDPQVGLPTQSNTEADAFALLARVVRQHEPAPLDGLKSLIRTVEPDFSEKRFGYSGFLQFCKAARRTNIIKMEWDEDAEDYLLRSIN